MSHLYEVEIKSLLGSKEKADNLISKLKKHDKNIKLSSQGRQLNHYFNVPEKINLKKVLLGLIPKDKKTSFDKIMKDGKKLSVRTRDADGKVLIVLKASVGDDSS